MADYVRFDWAMKRLLRDKANYVVLEGLLSTLLEKQIIIKELLESESNQDYDDDKQNRVDVLAEDETGALFLIEVQNNAEISYFQRMLFGTSKLLTQYIKRGDDYGRIRKVYSVNIVYFNLGGGKDYLYHGTTEFRGVHNGELLSLSPFQMQRFNAKEVKDLYPEYFILKVDGFNDVAKTPLEEWIRFLKDGSLHDKPSAPGLDYAKEVMRYDQLSEADKRNYDRRLMDAAIILDNVETAKLEGREEGRAEGRIEGLAEGRVEGLAEGRAEGRAEATMANARALLMAGVSADVVMQALGLTSDEMDKLQNF